MHPATKDLYRLVCAEYPGCFTFGNLYLVKTTDPKSEAEPYIFEEAILEELDSDWIVTKFADKEDVAALIQEDVFDANKMGRYIMKNCMLDDQTWPESEDIAFPLPKNWSFKDGDFVAHNGSRITKEIAEGILDYEFELAYDIDYSVNQGEYDEEAERIEVKDEVQKILRRTCGFFQTGEMVLFDKVSALNSEYVDLRPKGSDFIPDGHLEYLVFSQEGVSELIRNTFFTEKEMRNYVKANFCREGQSWPSKADGEVPIPYNWMFVDGAFKNAHFDDMVIEKP